MELERCLDALSSLKGNDTLILSGSLHLGVPTTVYAELIAYAKGKGSSVYLDASREALRFGLGSKPNLVKPNKLEGDSLLASTLYALRQSWAWEKVAQHAVATATARVLERSGFRVLYKMQLSLIK
ncbi:MAG: hypothetical protein ACRCYY_02895 [Trueperaceae bacterium]